MTRPAASSFVLVLALSLSAPACAVAAGNPGGDAQAAGRATIVPPYLEDARVVRIPGEPPTFRLVLRRNLPNPGWDLRVEDVSRSPTDRRVTVRLAEVAPPPESLYAQVITLRTAEVELGALEPGRYLVEVRAARPGSGPAVRVAALVVAAFER